MPRRFQLLAAAVLVVLMFSPCNADNNNTFVSFNVSLSVTPAELITEVSNVSGIPEDNITLVSQNQQSVQNPKLMQLLTLVGAVNEIVLSFETYEQATQVVSLANKGSFPHVYGAFLVNPISDDSGLSDKDKIIIGCCVGGGVLFIIIIALLIRNHRQSGEEGEYVQMGKKKTSNVLDA